MVIRNLSTSGNVIRGSSPFNTTWWIGSRSQKKKESTYICERHTFENCWEYEETFALCHSDQNLEVHFVKEKAVLEARVTNAVYAKGDLIEALPVPYTFPLP